jgi:predicted lipoprotein with Yx(FWY)xxD motif
MAPGASSSAASAPAAVGLNVSQVSTLGSFLVDDAGRTLYAFDKDTKNTSNCTSGTCAQNWHPLTAVDKSKLQSGIDGTLLGAIQRQDGSSQVTYNGLPLYYFVGDKNAGDTKGQGVGGLWWVISPAGDKIKTGGASSAPAAAPTTASSSSSGGYGQ